MDSIISIVKHILCYFLGHKKSHIMMAYSINVYSTSFRVEIYEVSICSRCGCISVNSLDRYEKYNWFSMRHANAEESELRRQGAVTLMEAYKELQNNEG